MTQRVTIVVAVLDGASTIERCIASVAGQSYADTELIVIDGGSTDGTVAVLERWSDAISHWDSAPDRGVYDAYNKALAHATGDWILFLGSDDYLWDARTLETVAPHLATHAGRVPVVYGQVAFTNHAGEIVEYRNEDWSYYRAIPCARWSFSTQGMFMHKSLFDHSEPFDLRFPIVADLDLLYGVLSRRDACFLPDTIIAVFTFGGLSTDPGRLLQIVRERRRSLQKHGLSLRGEPRVKATIKYVAFVVLRGLLGRGTAIKAVEQLMRLGRLSRGARGTAEPRIDSGWPHGGASPSPTAEPAAGAKPCAPQPCRAAQSEQSAASG